ncbi:hypothetical protein H5410_005595, partial [Solanum commersonii]
MQVQAQQQYLNGLTQRMIPYSRTGVNQFKIRNQMQRSHSKRVTQCMFSPIDQKGISKACNGAECK